jgi:hypothetical protein
MKRSTALLATADARGPSLHRLSGDPRVRRSIVVALTLYGLLCLRDPAVYRVIDALDLAIHETGHILFLPFGEFAHMLGGTLFQIGFPLLFVIHFLRRNDRFAASVTGWWVAQNLWNVSVYVSDARARALPLVGGGEHDWAYILGALDLLAHDRVIGRTLHVAGILIFTWCMLQAWWSAAPGARSSGVADALGEPEEGSLSARPGDVIRLAGRLDA